MAMQAFLHIALPLAVGVVAIGCASDPQSEQSGSTLPFEAGPDPELEQAIALLQSNDVLAAYGALEAWITEHPDAAVVDRAKAYRYAAHACALLREPEDGLAHADAGIALVPDEPWLHYARGVALHDMGEYEVALAALSRALSLDPMHLKAAQWRGQVYLLLGRPAEALLDYDTALAIIGASDDAVLSAWDGDRRRLTIASLLGRADALDALGRYDEAEADRERARALAANP